MENLQRFGSDPTYGELAGTLYPHRIPPAHPVGTHAAPVIFDSFPVCPDMIPTRLDSRRIPAGIASFTSHLV